MSIYEKWERHAIALPNRDQGRSYNLESRDKHAPTTL